MSIDFPLLSYLGKGLSCYLRSLLGKGSHIDKPTYDMVMVTTDGDVETGLMIVNGRIRSGTGVLADGVFIQQVIPDSIADQDGRCVHRTYVCRYLSRSLIWDKPECPD